MNYNQFSKDYINTLKDVQQEGISFSNLSFQSVFSDVNIEENIGHQDDNFSYFLQIQFETLIYKSLQKIESQINSDTLTLYIKKNLFVNINIYEIYKYLLPNFIVKGNDEILYISYDKKIKKSLYNNDVSYYKIFKILENGNEHFIGLQILSSLRYQLLENLNLLYNGIYNKIKKELKEPISENIDFWNEKIYSSYWSKI